MGIKNGANVGIERFTNLVLGVKLHGIGPQLVSNERVVFVSHLFEKRCIQLLCVSKNYKRAVNHYVEA